jgi:hypothetical protein
VTGLALNVNLLPQKIPFLRGIKARSVKANQVLPGNAGHFDKAGIGKENPIAVVGYDDSLVEDLQHGLHVSEPFRLSHID